MASSQWSRPCVSCAARRASGRSKTASWRSVMAQAATCHRPALWCWRGGSHDDLELQEATASAATGVRPVLGGRAERRAVAAAVPRLPPGVLLPAQPVPVLLLAQRRVDARERPRHALYLRHRAPCAAPRLRGG